VFVADRPNQLWLTDISEPKTSEGKIHLCAVKDVFSNRIVGYSIDSRMKSRLAVSAIENAVEMRGEVAVAWFTTPDPNFEAGSSCALPPSTAWSDRWDGWRPAVITPRWETVT
jgi:transposase InsO family protein